MVACADNPAGASPRGSTTMRPIDPQAHLRYPTPDALAEWAVDDCAADVPAAEVLLCGYAADLLAGGADEPARLYAAAASWLRHHRPLFAGFWSTHSPAAA